MNTNNNIANICQNLLFSKSKNMFDNTSGFELTREVYDKNLVAINHFVKEIDFMSKAKIVPNHFRFELDGDLYDFALQHNLKKISHLRS